MKRFWTVLSGVCLFLAFCVVPSFASSSFDSLFGDIAPYATSTAPVYPSGSNYPYFVGSEPSSRPGYSSGDYFTAVANSLRNGFVTMSKGLYDLQRSFSLYSTSFDAFYSSFSSLKQYLVGNQTNFSYLSGRVGLGIGNNGSSLYAISQSLLNGFYQTITELQDLATKVSSLNTSLSSSVSTLDSHFLSFSNHFSKLFPARKYFVLAYNNGAYETSQTDSYGYAVTTTLVNGFARVRNSVESLNKNFSAVFPNRNYFYLARSGGKISVAESSVLGIALSASLVNGFLQVDADLARIYDLLYDPQDEALKDESADQKDEFLDNFFGDAGNGVKPGQIGALGGISSGAGSLLDTGADMGSVFDEIGNPGSSVWSWFTAGNSEAINGASSFASEMMPYSPSDAPEPSPTVEVVDFYGAQRDEFLSMLGGG